MWTAGDQWRIDSAPTIDIASAPQDSTLVLMRVGGVVPLVDGGVAVVNGSDRQVLVFGPSGQLDHRIGRRGSGPGDLSRPTDALRCGRDSIVVNDVTRVSIFESGGPHVREWPIVPAVADGAVRLAGVEPDCSAFLLHARPERLPPAGDVGIAQATLFWTRGPELPRDTIGTFEARRVVRRT